MSSETSDSGLSQSELQAFRNRLLAMREEITGNVTGLEGQTLRQSGDDISVDHMADHGSDSYEQDQTIRLLESQSGTLREINAALKRLEEGVYGVCERTGKPIGKARLTAIPYARLCLEAQMEQEGG
jgi:RNA polymerase-binding protein DksA